MRSSFKSQVGVAFTGNGILGFANIALIELFEEVNYKPDLVIGCGTGSIIAGMWGLGKTAKQIIQFITQNYSQKTVQKADPYGFLFYLKSPGQYKIDHALIKTKPIMELLRIIFGEAKLEQLQPPTLVQTTNVATGDGAVFDQGLLVDLIYASGATIPFLPPIKIENEWYADGNFTSPVPVLELVNRNMQHIISLSFIGRVHAKPKSFLSHYSNFINQVFTKAQRKQVAMAIEMHHGEIYLLPVKAPLIEGKISPDEIIRIIDIARAEVEEHKDAILQLIQCQNEDEI